MQELKEERRHCIGLPTRAMLRWSGHSCRPEPTLPYRNVAVISRTVIELFIILQDDQGRTSAHKALEKKTEKGEEIFELIIRKHPKCEEILDNKGKRPTDR